MQGAQPARMITSEACRDRGSLREAAANHDEALLRWTDHGATALTAVSASQPGVTHASLLERWPRLDGIAHDLGLSLETVRSWHRRNAIAERHWESLAASAIKRGLLGINYDSFRRVEAARRRGL